MREIEKKDNVWHPFNAERPRFSLVVEIKNKNEEIMEAELVSEMSGWYAYSKELGWLSIDDITHWRFVQDKDYSGYEKMCVTATELYEKYHKKS